jgi:polyvinyl alcohol dehydrogenase (cytochrome)
MHVMLGMQLPKLCMAPLAVAALLCSSLATAMAEDALQPGQATFEKVCAICHTTIVSRASPTSKVDEAISRALPRETMRQLSAETVLAAITTGKMKVQGAALSDDERRAVAQYAAGSPFGALAYGAPSTEKPNPCKSPAAFHAAPGWNGWGNGLVNDRFQGRSRAGLAAADLPKLKLRWAFGYTNTQALRAQPTVYGHRLFVAGDSGALYSLDAKTGCTYWTYTAPAAVGTAPVVGPYKTPTGKSGYAVYVADRGTTVHAVDAQSGELIWKTKIDEHRAAGVSGAPALHAGSLYVPVQGVGEEGVGSTNNYPCCTFRGSVVALNADTGAVIWKTYTVPESKPRGKTSTGVELFGPSGAGIWASPTIDVARGALYVGTGNGYSDPPQPSTDAIIAMDLKTGAIRWMKQVATGDTWAMGCLPKNPDNPACPAVLGPDYDFAASPALVHMHGRDLLIAAQKAGLVYAMDPDRQGEIVWQTRYGKGSGLGGQYGIAVDGDRFFIGTADLLTPTPGGMHAIRIADGKLVWEQPPQPKLCSKTPGQACSAGQGAAPVAIAGAVLHAGLDGGLRAYSSSDGKLLWVFDTNQDFKTINGVAARGGSMDRGGPVIVDGMLYVNSGYGGFVGHSGNVLLAFGLD